jgi:2-amino-4-hydroxy-6-hydroxymethyldihydropteridine diphosphokinase
MAVVAYIGLGSNLDNPSHQVTSAIAELGDLEETQVIAVSRLYQSAPLGPAGQGDYINAAVAISTELAPDTLLADLQAIENRHGRVRAERWGPRTLDLDILLYGDLILDSPALHIPHPGLASRNFVLLPLADIAPNLRLPKGETLAQLLANVSAEGIVPLSAGD